MPIPAGCGSNRPAHTGHRESVFYMSILKNIYVIVIIDKLKIHDLPIDGYDADKQHQADPKGPATIVNIRGRFQTKIPFEYLVKGL
jgi:hypothetical protein